MKSMKAMKVAEQAEKSVQAQPVADMDRPATRPAWAKIREEDENVEVAQLEEDRWICTFDVQPNDSVASMLEGARCTGCSRGFSYEVIGVAVAVKKVPDP
ncbi:unnamed protein product [Symbiodinium microadriaticum]|nr:unnamed protein product [Symbiodinium microadriaticum]